MRSIGYNGQRNNIEVNHILGSSQCFATSAWMFMSFYDPNIDAGDDEMLSTFIADITRTRVLAEFEWLSQEKMIQEYFQRDGIMGTLKLGISLETGVGLTSKEELHDLLVVGPVIIGTKKMAGLPGGHIILAVDNGPVGMITCHDPYGNAMTGYADKNGAYVNYPVDMFDREYPDGPVRTLWFEV